MTGVATVEALFAERLPKDEVEIPGVGIVRVRGLNRLEAIHVQAAGDTAESDRRVIAQGMVEPSLLIPGLKHRVDDKPCEACADVRKWQSASSAKEMDAVANKIAELSGMAVGSEKDAYKSVRDDGGS